MVSDIMKRYALRAVAGVSITLWLSLLGGFSTSCAWAADPQADTAAAVRGHLAAGEFGAAIDAAERAADPALRDGLLRRIAAAQRQGGAAAAAAATLGRIR